MKPEYVTKTKAGYRISGSRVSLVSVVHDFLSGESPEGIAENYATLTLEQVYGAIAFYLAHRSAVDAHLQRNHAKFERLRRKSRLAHPSLYRRLSELQEVER